MRAGGWVLGFTRMGSVGGVQKGGMCWRLGTPQHLARHSGGGGSAQHRFKGPQQQQPAARRARSLAPDLAGRGLLRRGRGGGGLLAAAERDGGGRGEHNEARGEQGTGNALAGLLLLCGRLQAGREWG